MCLDMLCMQAVGNIRETCVCVSQHIYVYIRTLTQVCVFVCVYPNLLTLTLSYPIAYS